MKRFYKVIAIIVAVVMSVIPYVSAMAATTADITIDATGAFISYTSNVSTYSFGVVTTSSTTNTSGTYIGLTNVSSVSTNISIKMLAATWTSSGTGWTHSDTAADANTAAMKANSSNLTTWASSVFIKFSAPFNELASSVAAGSTVLTGLSLLAPTSFTDGSTNNNTIRMSFYQQ